MEIADVIVKVLNEIFFEHGPVNGQWCGISLSGPSGDVG